MGLVAFGFVALAVLFENRKERREVPRGPDCPSCRYNLDGLEPAGTCPECGVWYPATRWEVQSEFRVRAGVWRFVIACFVLAIAYDRTRAGELASSWGAIQGYLDAGYQFDVARNAARIRDPSVLGQFVGWCWVALTPVLALAVKGRMRYGVLVVVTALVLGLMLLLGL